MATEREMYMYIHIGIHIESRLIHKSVSELRGGLSHHNVDRYIPLILCIIQSIIGPFLRETLHDIQRHYIIKCILA